MKNTRNILITIGALGILLFSGCIPSLHPLYTESDRLTVHELYGTWISQSGHEQYDFQEHEEDSLTYKAIYAELPQKGFISRDSSRAEFEVNLVELEGRLFMDFYPLDDDPSLNEINSLMAVHLLPVHTFARLEISTDTVWIWRFDPEWLEQLFGENRIRIAHERVDGQIVLTASTRDLQEFIGKYSEEPGAYLNPEILIRQK